MENKQSGIRRLTRYVLLMVNWLVVVWLVLSYTAAVISPLTIRHLQLFSLFTPLAILANVLFVFIWLFSHKKRRIFISLLPLLIFQKVTFSVFGLNYFGDNDMAPRATTFRLMEWNVHGLGYFDPKGNSNAADILKVIKKEKPDVLCMAEYYVQVKDSTKPYSSTIMAQNNFKDYRFQADNLYGPLNMGIAIFSKYPILSYTAQEIGNSIYMLQFDVQVHGKRVRFFATHLCSFMLSDKDMAYITTLRHKKAITEKDMWNSRRYVWKFDKDYTERAHEANNAAAIIKQSPYPVIMCGDFNDLPASYTYTTIRDGLLDAFLKKGKGFGRTYNHLFPSLRIDHVFFTADAFKCLGYKSPLVNLSDHNPVIVNFEVK